MTRDLPPLEYVLTPRERDQAAWVAVYLERLRRKANAEERSRDTRLRTLDLLCALEAAHD